MEALANVVDRVCDVLANNKEPDDKMFVSIFQELRISIEQKLILRRNEYGLTMKPYQAIAFWLCFNESFHPNPQVRNMIMLMCNGIHQQYLSK
jgi:hypothetical protein